MNNLLIFVLTIPYCFSNWVLEWNDEFNGSNLDLNNWNVTNGIKDVFESDTGDLIYSYSKNSTRNVLVQNGTLALNAYREEFNGRPFTGATITSLNTLLYGRVDIRAALPEGILLKTNMVMNAKEDLYGDKNGDGHIEIIVDLQRAEFYASVLFDQEQVEETRFQPRYPLNDFSNYSLEWNETQLTWRLNDQVYFKFDLTRNRSALYRRIGEPFDKEFYLSLSLQVYSTRKIPFKSAAEYHKDWICPSFLIDHVRYYKQDSFLSQSQIEEESLRNTNYSRKDICESIKLKFYKSSFDQDYSMKDFVLYLVIPFCIILIISITGIVLFFIFRKSKDNIRDSSNDYYSQFEISNSKFYNDPDYDDNAIELYDQAYAIPQSGNQTEYLDMQIASLKN